MRWTNVLVWMLWFAAPCGSATEYWASPTGSATGIGTLGDPWNLAKAGSTPVAGDTVHIMAGFYGERLIITRSGSAGGGMITYLGDAGAILDGTDVAIPTGDFVGLVHINGQRYVRVEGLEICNWKTTSASATPVGIFVHSASGVTTDIQIVGNHVHDIWQRAAKAGAHGIGVYGDHATAISNLLIQNNEIDHCQLGWSETLAVNGNIDGFEISDNSIHDNNNIGIDCIGYEGTAPVGSPDYARNGVIARNTVRNIHSNGYDGSSANPAYATNDDSAGGIYVDGARDTVIERNLVYDCDIGIEIGAEHAGGAKNSMNCTLRNNILHTTIQGCINLGGYAKNLSWTENCLITHNTCFNADTKNQGYGLIVLQKSRTCTFTNNILIAKPGDYVISATLNAANVIGHVFDWNIYWKTNGTPAFQLASGQSYTGLSAFRTATGQDANSAEVDPLLVSLAGALDFHLQSSSTAIDGGDPAFIAAAGELDFSGMSRIQGGRTDIGGYESGSVVTGPEIVVLRDGAMIADAGTDTVTGTVPATARTLSYTIANTGTTALSVGATGVITGVNCTVSIDTAAASSVIAGGSTNLVLTVTPGVAGSWSFPISFTTDDADENPSNWTVSGTAAIATGTHNDSGGGSGGCGRGGLSALVVGMLLAVASVTLNRRTVPTAHRRSGSGTDLRVS